MSEWAFGSGTGSAVAGERARERERGGERERERERCKWCLRCVVRACDTRTHTHNRHTHTHREITSMYEGGVNGIEGWGLGGRGGGFGAVLALMLILAQ